MFSRGSSKPQTISIHAPAWGATCEAGILIDVTLFQSTLPRGERLASSFFSSFSFSISIHAPAWGATAVSLQPLFSFWDFNPRSRVGSDGLHIDANFPNGKQFQSTLPRGERRYGNTVARLSDAFQSTLPRGERRVSGTSSLYQKDFNPRSRVGSDSKRSQSKGESSVYLCINSPNITSFLYSIILFYKFQPQILVRTSRQFSVYFHFAL